MIEAMEVSEVTMSDTRCPLLLLPFVWVEAG